MSDGLSAIAERLGALVERHLARHLRRHAPFVIDRIQAYWVLMRFHRPIGTQLLLWPTLWALWIASGGHPRPDVLVVFVGGVVLMRAAGCVINDYFDRGFDVHVRRTQDRPIATGRVSPNEALGVFAVLVLMAFALVLTQNLLTIELSVVAVVLAGVYPLMKRVTYLPQAHLGVAFGWAVPMVFAAQTGSVPPVAWLLFIAVVLWALAYDTLYAMVDRPDDLRVGVRSTAILFGDLDRHAIGIAQATFLFTLMLVGRKVGLGTSFHIALAIAAVMVVRQLWMVRKRDMDACFNAFLDNNRVGLVVFVGIALDYLFRSAP